MRKERRGLKCAERAAWTEMTERRGERELTCCDEDYLVDIRCQHVVKDKVLDNLVDMHDQLVVQATARQSS